ncbi:DUF4157 domain-containing protein [uncultured Aquimarina sp.]|uniref:eCIS core domain-containing protein n=1 Tax=uncultured Aquimarina sp. TaxID=575652 RepID=UPI002632DB98|nr:DUF4157 domain-containing protein [uncultured Aquimarina sp.]
MKKKIENTQEPQKETVQRAQQEPSTGGEATIADNRPVIAVQRKLRSAMGGAEDTTNSNPIPVQRKTRPEHSRRNNTGLPDNLKSGIENLSGYSMDDVKVHYNSSKPAQLQAHAYAQGTDIHLASGQEKHLPHEAWHVVQQKQGRVKPTKQLKSKVNINDDAGLEKEADVMGAKAALNAEEISPKHMRKDIVSKGVIQRLVGYEIEARIPIFGKYNMNGIKVSSNLVEPEEEVVWFLTGGLKYGGNYGEETNGRFHITADHNIINRNYQKILEKLVLLGLLKPNVMRKKMSNIEYITPPREEIEQGSLDTQERDITAVKDHLDETLKLAQGQTVEMVPEPGLEIFTGLPRKQLIDWLETNSIDQNLIIPELNNFEQSITDSVYIQENSGVLPEDIPEVFNNASEAIESNQQANNKQRMMADLMRKANMHAEQAFESLKLPPKQFVKDKKAVLGYLSLISSYLIANEFSFLKDFLTINRKNLLPFLSKTPLEDTKNALPTSVRPSTVNSKVWNKLTASLLRLMNEDAPAEYWAKTYNCEIVTRLRQNGNYHGKVFNVPIEESMKSLSKGGTFSTGINTGNALGLDQPSQPLKKAMIKSKKEKELHKQMANKLNNARKFGRNYTVTQKGIPLEDRYFNAKYSQPLTADNMVESLKKSFWFLTKLQINSLQEETLDENQEMVKEEVNDNTLLTQKLLLLKKRLTFLKKSMPQRGEYGYALLKTQLLEINRKIQQLNRWIKNKKSIKKEDFELFEEFVNEKYYDEIKESSQTLNEDELTDLEPEENTLNYRNFTFEEAQKNMLESFDTRFTVVFEHFNKRGLKAENLPNEEDQKTMEKKLGDMKGIHRFFEVTKRKIKDHTEKTPIKDRVEDIKNLLGIIEFMVETIKFYDRQIQVPRIDHAPAIESRPTPTPDPSEASTVNGGLFSNCLRYCCFFRP